MTSVTHERGRTEHKPAWVLDLLIGGRPVPGQGAEIDVPNPATGEHLTSVRAATLSQVDEAVAAARHGFDHGQWPRMSPGERSAALHRVADRLAAMHGSLSEALVMELGTPVSLAETLQTDLAVQALREYADLAADDGVVQLGPHFDPVPSASLVARRPVGVAAIISAYNFPILLAVRGLGGALAAGCTGILLPSPRAPLTTLLIASVFDELPPGTVNVIVGGPEVGQRLTRHPGVDKVGFTGSMGVGAQIMQQASGTAKSISLELGDKAPAVVLPGVDLEAYIPAIHFGYLMNSGQACGSTTRLIVPDSLYDEFVRLSRDFIEHAPVGDPWDPQTLIGPLIRPEHLQSVQAMVDSAVANGAVIAAQGKQAKLGGWYMPPVLLDNVASQDVVAQQESFGPVGTILRYNGDIEQAVMLANDTPYGLHAKVYTPDTKLGMDVAARLRAGSVVVNGGGFRPDAPFGGMRRSGIGREYGQWGIDEFSEVQHVQWAMA